MRLVGVKIEDVEFSLRIDNAIHERDGYMCTRCKKESVSERFKCICRGSGGKVVQVYCDADYRSLNFYQDLWRINLWGCTVRSVTVCLEDLYHGLDKLAELKNHSCVAGANCPLVKARTELKHFADLQREDLKFKIDGEIVKEV